MSTVTELRRINRTIRLYNLRLGVLKDSESTHPEKPEARSTDSKKLIRWETIRKDFERQRLALKRDIEQLEVRKTELEDVLNDDPVAKVSMSYLLTRLTEIEAKFSTDGTADGWDSLSAFIDFLEKEEQRIAACGKDTALEVSA